METVAYAQTATPTAIGISSSEGAYPPRLWLAYNTITPTPTATRVPSPTPTPVVTAAPTVSVASLKINEVCSYALKDYNLDGNIDSQDAYIVLWNGTASDIDLESYYIELVAGMAKKILPRSIVYASRFKYIFGEDLLPAWIPSSGAVTVNLRNPYFAVVDTFTYSYVEPGKCWKRIYPGGPWGTTPGTASLDS